MNYPMNEIKICEVCGDTQLIPVLNLGLHPMCDDLVRVGEERICNEYPIEIVYCKTCFTAHQRFQVPKQDLFPTSYHYRSRFTTDVLNGMESLVNSCEQTFGTLSGKKILDIGCNDGSLLDFFRKKNATTIGIEPTDACHDAREKGHFTFNNYFTVDVAKNVVAKHGKPDFITFTNVFAHIENLNEILDALKILLDSQTVLIIENHYLGAVLDRHQFDTFYHEHPRSYSYTSFTHIASKLGVKFLHLEFPSRYGGNIRVFLGNHSKSNIKSVDISELTARESRFMDDFIFLEKNMRQWQKSKLNFIQDLNKKYGKIRAKAFPGRAAILIKMLGVNSDMISAVYEKPGSLKIGNYLPGTRIPICSDNDLFALENQDLPLLNLAWHIPTEIRTYLKEHGYTGEVLDILDSKDFI